MWLHDVSAFHKGLWGSWPSPRGGHNGDVIGEASRVAASSTPIPPKVPGGGRLLILGQNLRRAEGQMGPFPWDPSWGRKHWSSPPSVRWLRGSWHSSQLCSADSTYVSHVFPACRESKGSGGQNVLAGYAAYPLWDLPPTGHSPFSLSFPVPPKEIPVPPAVLFSLGCW